MIKVKNYSTSTIIMMIYNALIIITQETGWHKWQIAVYTFKYLHLNGGAEVPPCRLCKLNLSINIFFVAIPNQMILHTCYSSHYNSMSSLQITWFNTSVLRAAMPNQIILQTCYLFFTLLLHVAMPNQADNLQKYTIP